MASDHPAHTILICLVYVTSCVAVYATIDRVQTYSQSRRRVESRTVVADMGNKVHRVS